MIHPVSALTPKVLFRGETVNGSKESGKEKVERTFAAINATGISIALGAVTTAIARSNTSSWRHASYFGIGAGLISMMFLYPGLLYKAGIGTSKTKDKDFFIKEIDASKKFAKNTTKSALKSMPKI